MRPTAPADLERVRPAGPVDLGRSPHALLRPLPRARIAAGFWAERQRLNREVLLPEGARRLDAAGNFDNLRIAAGRRAGGFKGLLFLDSDLYKWVEALGWELGRAPSDTLAALADDAIDLIADAQDESGYLNSYYQVAQPGPRFGNLSWDHELYCLGHLIQAAVRTRAAAATSACSASPPASPTTSASASARDGRRASAGTRRWRRR